MYLNILHDNLLCASRTAPRRRRRRRRRRTRVNANIYAHYRRAIRTASARVNFGRAKRLTGEPLRHEGGHIAAHLQSSRFIIRV